MENIIKGWVFSLIGLICFIGVLAHWTGIYNFPNPDFLNNTWECVIGLIVSAAFFSLPKTDLDRAIEKAFSSLMGKASDKTS